MIEEKDSPYDYIESHKETGSHDPNDDGVLLESDKRASAERRLVKKLDYRLLPTIIVIFIMSFVDVRQPRWVQYFVFINFDVAFSCNIGQACWT